MPDVCLHPCTTLLLSQFILIEKEAELASVATTLGPAQYFTFVWLELVKRLEADSHRNPVVIMRHASTSEVPCNKLYLHLRRTFGLEDIRKVTQLMGPTAHELIQVDELWYFSILLGKIT